MAKPGVLEVKIKGDADQFKKEVGGAGDKLKKFGKLAAAGGAAVVAGLGAAIKATADYGDRVAKTARTVGFQTEALQEVEFAMGQYGLSTKDTENVLMKFNKRIGDAAKGEGTAAQAIEDMNISLRDQQGEMRTQDDLFSDVINKLSGMESSQERAAAASDFFGDRAGPKLASAIEGGTEGIDELRERAQELGIVMSDEAAQKAEEFNDRIDDLKKGFGGLVRTVGAEFIPILADHVLPMIRDQFLPAVRALTQNVGPALIAMFRTVGDVLAPLAGALEAVTQGEYGLIKAFQVGSETAGKTFEDMNALEKAASTLGGAWETLRDTATDIFNSVRDVVDDVFKGIKKWLSDNEDQVDEWRSKLTKILDAVMDVFRQAFDFLSSYLRTIIGVMSDLWDRFGTHLLEFIRNTFGRILDFVSGVLDVIAGVIKTATGIISGDWDQAWEGIKQIFSGVWDAITAILGQVLDGIETILGAGVAAISLLWSEVWERMQGIVEERLEEIVEFFRGLPGRVVEQLETLKTSMEDHFGEIWKSIKRGVADFISDIVTFFKELPGKIVDALAGLGSKIKGAFDFDLPSLSLPFVGDGPGFAGQVGYGGTALQTVKQAMQGLPLTITSTYRTPAQNAAAGGSPTSYHMDRSNPAVDVGGPSWALDILNARLPAGREKLWRTAGHFDHLHFAERGGVFDQATLAVLGEASSNTNREIATPERLMRRIVRDEARRGGDGASMDRQILTELRKLNATLQSRSVEVSLDGDRLTDKLERRLADRARQPERAR